MLAIRVALLLLTDSFVNCPQLLCRPDCSCPRSSVGGVNILALLLHSTTFLDIYPANDKCMALRCFWSNSYDLAKWSLLLSSGFLTGAGKYRLRINSRNLCFTVKFNNIYLGKIALTFQARSKGVHIGWCSSCFNCQARNHQDLTWKDNVPSCSSRFCSSRQIFCSLTTMLLIGFIGLISKSIWTSGEAEAFNALNLSILRWRASGNYIGCVLLAILELFNLWESFSESRNAMSEVPWIFQSNCYETFILQDWGSLTKHTKPLWPPLGLFCETLHGRTKFSWANWSCDDCLLWKSLQLAAPGCRITSCNLE